MAIADQQLRDAVYGAQNITAPTDASALAGQPEVAAAFKTRFQAPVIQAAATGLVNQSQENLQEQADAAKAAAQAAKDAQDPSKFQRIPKSDGGYAFYDPTGKEISAQDYALATSQGLDKVLANSQNPIDINFQNDYNNLKTYLTAWQNNDKKTIDAIQKASPALAKIKNPQQLINQFMTAYPTIFAQGGFQGPGTAGEPTGSSFIPNASAQKNNATYLGNSGGIGF